MKGRNTSSLNRLRLFEWKELRDLKTKAAIYSDAYSPYTPIATNLLPRQVTIGDHTCNLIVDTSDLLIGGYKGKDVSLITTSRSSPIRPRLEYAERWYFQPVKLDAGI